MTGLLLRAAEPRGLAVALLAAAIIALIAALTGVVWLLLPLSFVVAAGWLVDRRGSRRRAAAGDGLTAGVAEPHPRPSLELASCYVPAQHGAAGDFYLVTAGPGDATTVVVGDVAGKGMAAARRAAFVRTAFAASAPYTDDPCRLLDLVNSALLEQHGDQAMLVTCACMVFAPARHEISYALAGHPAPMWLDDGSPLNSVEPGYPLGVEQRTGCASASSRFESGAGLMAFTDGLSEARRGGGELFGVDRIARALAALRGAPPAKVVRELRREAERFAGGALPDDLCIVALRAS